MSTLRNMQLGGSIVGPYMEDAATLTALANVIREGSGYEDIGPVVKEFEAGTEASNARLQDAFTQSQQDPRSIIDKVQPGLQGLAAIIDLIRKKKGTPQKYDFYRQRYQQGLEQKRQMARQKYMDVLSQEELLGKRRGQVFEAKAGAVQDRNAQRRQAGSSAAGVKSDRDAARRQAGIDAMNKRKLDMDQQRFDLEVGELKMNRRKVEAADALLKTDQATWDKSDYALVSEVYPNLQIETPQETAVRMFGELRQEAAKAFQSSVDTEGMGPEEVASALAVFTQRYVENAMLSMPEDGQARDPFTTNIKPGGQRSTRIGTPDMYGGGGIDPQAMDPSILEAIGRYTGVNSVIDWGKRTTSRYTGGK